MDLERFSQTSGDISPSVSGRPRRRCGNACPIEVDNEASTERTLEASRTRFAAVLRFKRYQLRVFEMLGRGMTRKEIAFDLKCTLSTVNSTCDHIRRITGIEGAEVLYLFAREYAASGLRIEVNTEPATRYRFVSGVH